MFAETTAAWVPFDMRGRPVSPRKVIQTAFFECPSNGCNAMYFSHRYGPHNEIEAETPYSAPSRYMGELTREEIFERAFVCRGVLSGSDEGAVTRARAKKAKP